MVLFSANFKLFRVLDFHFDYSTTIGTNFSYYGTSCREYFFHWW